MPGWIAAAGLLVSLPGERCWYSSWVLATACWGSWMLGCAGPPAVPPVASLNSAPQSRPFEPTPVAPPLTAPNLPTPVLANPWEPAVPARPWKYIVLHHTATDRDNVESIHEVHLKNKDKAGNPWLGIGYHFVVGNGAGMPDGEIEPTFRWRQQLQGAHAGVLEFNQQGIGVVLVGNFEKQPPTRAQLEATRRLVGTLKQFYGIDEQHVVGHGDVKATECPGHLFPLGDVRLSVAQTFRAPGPLTDHAKTARFAAGLNAARRLSARAQTP